MNATVVTSVVMVEGRINQAPKIEMRLNAPISKNKVSVLVDNQIISFDDGVRRREFWGKLFNGDLIVNPSRNIEHCLLFVICY